MPDKTRAPDMRLIRTTLTKFETREETDGLHLSGYFAVFNQTYELNAYMSESIAPGAFSSSMGNDVRALTNHDTTLVLGRTAAGTLQLREDSHGLWGDILVNPKDTDAMNTYERVMRGDVNQCSFGFEILDEEYTVRDDGGSHWTIKDLRLHEVSVCTFPAYPTTSVSARSAQLAEIRSRSTEAWKEKMKGVLAKWH